MHDHLLMTCGMSAAARRAHKAGHVRTQTPKREWYERVERYVHPDDVEEMEVAGKPVHRTELGATLANETGGETVAHYKDFKVLRDYRCVALRSSLRHGGACMT